MSKMGSLGSFEHLKHKLWPKERPGETSPLRPIWVEVDWASGAIVCEGLKH